MTGWGGSDEPPDGEAELASKGTALQFNLIRVLLRTSYPLEQGVVQLLHLAAMSDLDSTPGMYRTEDTIIIGSRHIPPPSTQVPDLMRGMMANIRDEADPIIAAAYALWRLNWIHPFNDGNGRTARALCYLVLCKSRRRLLPGRVELTERIRRERLKYQKCLEEADGAWARGNLNVSHMAGFLRRLVKEQIADAP